MAEQATLDLTYLGNAGPPAARWRKCDFCKISGINRRIVTSGATGRKYLSCPNCPQEDQECPICADECPDAVIAATLEKENEHSKPTECDRAEAASDSDLPAWSIFDQAEI